MTTEELEAIEIANETTERKINQDIALIEKYREELEVHRDYYEKLISLYDKHPFMSQWEHGLKMIEAEIKQNQAEFEAATNDLEAIKNLNN